MAEGELGFEVEFGHGAVQGGQVEEWIVAEAACASWSFEDKTLDRALGGMESHAVAGGDQHAAVAGGAAGWRDPGKALQEDHVVPHVGVVVGVGRVDQAGVGGEASGADAWGALEGVYFEAGVVGQDQVSGDKTGVVDGLVCGVGGEGGAVLFGGRDGGEQGQGIDGEGMGLGGGAEVAELALAGGGGVEAEGHGKSVTGGATFHFLSARDEAQTVSYQGEAVCMMFSRKLFVGGRG